MARNFSHTSNFFFGSNLFGEETLYAIQSCNLPGLSFTHIMTATRGVSAYIQGDTITYTDLNIEIIVDEELKTWKDIVGSMQKMRDPVTSSGELIEKISWLEIHDDNSKLILKLYFQGSKIESIGDLQYLSTGEDEILILPCTIKYDYYTIEDL